MCEVCAVFGRGIHWTARASAAAELAEAVDIGAYRAERRRALVLINALLASRGLQAQDWDGESYVLTASSGATARAEHLSDIWAAVTRLGAAEVDPLAKNFAESHA